MRWYILGIVLLAWMVVGAAASAVVSNTAVQDGVELRVSLPKDSYIIGEPIVATFSVKNCSNAPRRMADATLSDVVGFRVRRITAGPEPIHIEVDCAPPTDDIAWTLAPGESRSVEADLLDRYFSSSDGPLLEGTYELDACYSAPSIISVVWQGKLAIRGMRFTISPAAGRERGAAAAFGRLRHHISARAAAEVLHSLTNPAIGYRFARYAGYWEARAYAENRRYDEAIQAMRRYLLDHPDVPHYSRDASYWLSLWLYLTGDLTAARGEILRTPDGFDRRSILQRIDKAIARRSRGH